MCFLNANNEPVLNLYAVDKLIYGNYFNSDFLMNKFAIGAAMTSGHLAGQCSGIHPIMLSLEPKLF